MYIDDKYNLVLPKTIDLPASALQDHPDCILIADEAAASLLKNK